MGAFAPSSSVDFNRYFRNTDVGVTTIRLCQTENNSCRDTSLAYVVRHPRYDGEVNNGDDIALIILPQGLQITPSITPVMLNRNRNVPAAGQMVEAFGWGLTSNSPDDVNRNPNEIQTGQLQYFINANDNDDTIMYARTTVPGTNGVAVGRGDSGTSNFEGLCISST
jgi:hypothetical protein